MRAYAQGAPPQRVLRNNRVRFPARAREHSQLGDKLNKKYPLVSCGTGMRYRLQDTSKQVEHRQSHGCTPRHEHKRLGSSVETVRQTPTVPHDAPSYTGTVRLAVYERDNWVCQICGKPVLKRYIKGSHANASVDHIIPQSQQLIPDHSDNNLRTAHHICNSIRGNRDVTDEYVAQIAQQYL